MKWKSLAVTKVRSQKELMSEIDTFDFNTLKFCRDFGRIQAPLIVTYYIIKGLKVDLIPMLDMNKLLDFVQKIF